LRVFDPRLRAKSRPPAADGGELTARTGCLFHQEALAAADDVRVEPSAEPPVGGHQQKLHPAERADGHQRVGREVRLGPGARQLRQHFVDELGVGAGAHHRSCARRSLAAATIFMALVIFCVFRTDRMRVRMKRRDATFPYAFADSVGGTRP